MKINILPEKIIKLILSDEVIKSYSSIIKELIENSIDAKAKNISIYIDNYVNNITVKDDGCGMNYKDAIISYLKGTTSKIKNEKDLLNINSIGFRGIALYCISNISRMEIITKSKKNKIGLKLIIEYGKLIKKIPYYCNTGCSISIKNIFFNYHNKIKFLLSNKEEYKKIKYEIKKLIIGNNKINFKLYHNNKLIFIFKSSSKLERIYNIYYKNNNNNILTYKKKYKYLKLKLFLLFSKNNKYIYVNNKFINNNEYYKIINNYLLKYYNKKTINFLLFISINNKYVNFNINSEKNKVLFNYNIKINKIIKLFLKFFINKNYFYNKKIINYFNLKQKKKKLYIYNNKEINYINNFFFNFNKKNIKTLKINNNYVFLIIKNKLLIFNIKKAKEKIFYNYYLKSKIKINYKQLLLFPIKFKIPFNIKKFNILNNKISKFFNIKFKKKYLFIYSIPYFLNYNNLFNYFNIIFLLLKNNKIINLYKLNLLFLCKNKKFFFKNKNIKYLLFKLFRCKNYFISINNKKLFYIFNKN
ncbi:DNA mismatch repair endonuclease MutL [Candidatus Shikimatogenerans bostrichidophilus]|uniref:DNA mismatch repair endonuclease MutL n=1 Tax=Candidatus Shikimatogenerans bostrichidophilus TaxID=2943807 RepID=UPI002966020D